MEVRGAGSELDERAGGGDGGEAGGGSGHFRLDKRSAVRENHAHAAARRGIVLPNATPVHV